MRRCGSISSSPLAAPALLLLLLVVAGCFFHCSAAARLLPSSVPIPALVVHQAENGVTAAPGAADSGLVLQEGGVGNGDELSISEMMGAESEEEEEEEAVACEEGNDEECMQRRLLRDAHLDYIYTQHKGKP